MIKLNGNQRTVRECMAPFQYVDDKGETANAEIRVRYFSLTIKEIKANQARAKAAGDDETRWISDELAERIAELPDLQDEKGKPFKITAANLENIDLTNLMNIQQAVADDLSPKVQPVRSPAG